MALLAALATPTLSQKTVIVEQEFDEVTAGGQPKIAQAEAFEGHELPGECVCYALKWADGTDRIDRKQHFRGKPSLQLRKYSVG